MVMPSSYTCFHNIYRRGQSGHCVYDAAGSSSSAWEGWLKGAFQAALAGAPLDLAEAWAAAVRFAVNALAFTNPAGMDAVLQVIIQQPPQGRAPLICPSRSYA